MDIIPLLLTGEVAVRLGTLYMKRYGIAVCKQTSAFMKPRAHDQVNIG